MAMKGFSTFPKDPRLEPRNQNCFFFAISWTLVGGGSLMSLQWYSQCILQCQRTGLCENEFAIYLHSSTNWFSDNTRYEKHWLKKKKPDWPTLFTTFHLTHNSNIFKCFHSSLEWKSWTQFTLQNGFGLFYYVVMSTSKTFLNFSNIVLKIQNFFVSWSDEIHKEWKFHDCYKKTKRNWFLLSLSLSLSPWVYVSPFLSLSISSFSFP